MSRKKLTSNETFPGLPNRIKFLRGTQTQKEFGELLGVSKATVSKYESGINIPSSDILKKIASVGNKSIEWILRGDQPSTPQHLEHADTHKSHPGSPLDVALLAEIMTEVKKLIAEKHMKLSPQQEARLVALVYSHCQEGKVKPNRDLVDRCLWITTIN
jgi:transcriptional regulator with XRE-family HTH domain